MCLAYILPILVPISKGPFRLEMLMSTFWKDVRKLCSDSSVEKYLEERHQETKTQKSEEM